MEWIVESITGHVNAENSLYKSIGCFTGTSKSIGRSTSCHAILSPGAAASDLLRRLALAVFAPYFCQSNGGPPASHVAAYNDTDPAFVYSGDWVPGSWNNKYCGRAERDSVAAALRTRHGNSLGTSPTPPSLSLFTVSLSLIGRLILSPYCYPVLLPVLVLFSTSTYYLSLSFQCSICHWRNKRTCAT